MKTTEGLDSFTILKNVNQTSQTSFDQTLPDLPQKITAIKTSDPED